MTVYAGRDKQTIVKVDRPKELLRNSILALLLAAGIIKPSMSTDFLYNRMYRFHALQADATPVKVSKDGCPAISRSYTWIYRTGKEYGEIINVRRCI